MSNSSDERTATLEITYSSVRTTYFQKRGAAWSSGLVFAAMIAALGTAAVADCADLGLVLAIDASGSINTLEYAAQIQGYSDALKDRKVVAAIKAAGRVEIGAIIWGDEADATLSFPLRRINSFGDLKRLASKLRYAPRRTGGHTGLGRAVDEALTMLAPLGGCGSRLVINVSGDGRESTGTSGDAFTPIRYARERAEVEGVTINGLTIRSDEEDVPEFYKMEVITGPGAFVMSVESFETFGKSLIKKLDREIRPLISADTTTDFQ